MRPPRHLPQPGLRSPTVTDQALPGRVLAVLAAALMLASCGGGGVGNPPDGAGDGARPDGPDGAGDRPLSTDGVDRPAGDAAGDLGGDGSGGPRLADGKPCAQGNECASGFCADGVC